ncbi:MAG TPA: MarR family transcriptional regulator [Pseudonocardiaceae bacterium]|nr:MarR family transcriptional regulator [Pseudonocardiaceae bacterium]
MSELSALFTRASKLWRNASDEAMRQHGVRVGQNLLLQVLWNTDGLTPGELAEQVQVSTPTVVKSVNRMEAAGLLTKRRDTVDRRLVRIYLTERAKNVQGAVQSARAELEQRVTATLTEDERANLVLALRKINAQLDTITVPER